jgi:hypothetical protein
MNLQEQIRRILKEETKQLDKPYVVFVSGIQSVESHETQTKRFINNFGAKYPVKSFNFANQKQISDFLKNNYVIALVLYSAGGQLANKFNFPPNRIYCIEPWNGNNGRAGLFTSIPANNMFINSKIPARGKGTKEGNVILTNDFGNHFEALSKSAAILSNRI